MEQIKSVRLYEIVYRDIPAGEVNFRTAKVFASSMESAIQILKSEFGEVQVETFYVIP